MTHLPALTSRRLIAALEKADYFKTHQSDSHCILEHPSRRMVVVPIHARDIRRPLMISIIGQIELTEEKFLSLL